jgi:hypothetical protein
MPPPAAHLPCAAVPQYTSAQCSGTTPAASLHACPASACCCDAKRDASFGRHLKRAAGQSVHVSSDGVQQTQVLARHVAAQMI